MKPNYNSKDTEDDIINIIIMLVFLLDNIFEGWRFLK